MTKRDLIILQNGINSVVDLSGVKFAYGISKNSALIKPEIDAINKAIEASKDYKDYDQKRVELATIWAKKDKDGKPLHEGGVFIFEDKDSFDKAFDEFKKPYADLIEKRKIQVEDYNKLLDDEVDIKLHKIDLEDIPSNITTGQLLGIANLIKE